MKSIITLILFLPLLFGCATTKQSTPLLSTINIGVLHDTRLDDWRLLTIDNPGIAGNVASLPYERLLEEMAAGNLDLIVGIPETDDVAEVFSQNSIVIASRAFDYLVYKGDERQLDEYVFESNFLKQVNRLGYVASGEPGVVNELVLPDAKSHQTYVACNSTEQCHLWLKNQEIDAFYSDVDVIENDEINLDLVAVGFEKTVEFTLLMNKKTLTENEQETLRDIFSI